MSKWIAVLVLAVAHLGLSGCEKKIRLDLLADPADTAYFGSGMNGAMWLGKPVRVDAANGTVELLSYPQVPWAERCRNKSPEDKAARAEFESGLENAFLARELRDSLTGKKAAWDDIRANVLVAKQEGMTAANFRKLFTTPAAAEFAEILFPYLRSPTLFADMEPAAHLGFASRAYTGGAGASISEKFAAGVKAKHKTLHAVVVSRTGQLALNGFAADCAVAAARALDSKPTHVVDAISMGVLFQFDLEVNGFETTASGGNAAVQLRGEIKGENVRINAALLGAMDPPKISLFDVYDPEKPQKADTQVLGYFTEFARGIRTPVFVSAHLRKLE